MRSTTSTPSHHPIRHAAVGVAVALACLPLGACFDSLTPGEASTPEALVASLSKAMAQEPADLAFFFRQVRFENESHAQMAEGMADFFSTLIAIDSATREQFGESVWTDLAENLQAAEFDSVELVDAGSDNNGTIRVTSADDGTTEEIQIVKADGRWWLDAASMGETFDESEAGAAQATRHFKLLTETLTSVSERLDQGEFKSAKEVEAAIQEEMMLAMLSAMSAED